MSVYSCRPLIWNTNAKKEVPKISEQTSIDPPKSGKY